MTERAGMSEAQAGHLLMLLLYAGAAATAARSQQAKKAASARWHCGPDAERNASASTRTGEESSTALNPHAQTCLRAEAGAGGGASGPAPALPPAALDNYTPDVLIPATAQACAPQQVAPSPPPISPPQKTGVCVYSEILKEEENTHTEGGGGGGRLFPAMIQDELPAQRIVDAYDALVKPAYPSTRATVRTVSWWLAHGQTEEELMRAVDNYAADMNRIDKQARYRKAPSNFFGRTEAPFLGYTKARTTAAAPPRPRPRPVEEAKAPAGTFRQLLEKAGLRRQVS
jgi:hypothetical protein